MTAIAGPEERASRPMLGCMSFEESDGCRKIRSVADVVARVDKGAKAQEPAEDTDSVMKRGSTLRTLLYSVGTLRKRAGQENHD